MEHIAPHDLRRTCAKLCHDRGGELEQIQFLLGHASVQTTEHYLGCKQNLEHPVNDLFDLRADAERGSVQGIECRRGGSADERPSATPNRYPYQNEPIWSRSERTIARKVFDAALKRELLELMQEAKRMASQIKEPADVWK